MLADLGVARLRLRHLTGHVIGGLAGLDAVQNRATHRATDRGDLVTQVVGESVAHHEGQECSRIERRRMRRHHGREQEQDDGRDPAEVTELLQLIEPGNAILILWAVTEQASRAAFHRHPEHFTVVLIGLQPDRGQIGRRLIGRVHIGVPQITASSRRLALRCHGHHVIQRRLPAFTEQLVFLGALIHHFDRVALQQIRLELDEALAVHRTLQVHHQALIYSFAETDVDGILTAQLARERLPFDVDHTLLAIGVAYLFGHVVHDLAAGLTGHVAFVLTAKPREWHKDGVQVLVHRIFQQHIVRRVFALG